MKQTALGWVLDCLIEKHSNGSFVWNTRADLEALFEQAKEMEKQQIIDAVDKTNSKWKSQKAEIILSGEQYYNETFNK